MTRIRNNLVVYLELCLAWSLLVVVVGGATSSSGGAPLDNGAAAAGLNDLLEAEAFRGRTLQGLEELTWEEMDQARRALQQDTEDNSTTTTTTTPPPSNITGTKLDIFSFATQTPTSAPAPGDFKELNELFRTVVLTLPDTDIQEQVLFQLLQIALRNLECSQLGFDDLKITPELKSQKEAGVDMSVVNFGLTCEFDFQWSYIFLVGNGHANVRVGDSSADAGMNFFSQNFTMYPPDSAQVTDCNTDIKILGIDFSGNIASEIFNLFEQLIVDTMNGLLNGLICGTLKEEGSGLIGEALDLLYEFISPYLEPADPWRYNITYAEDTMYVPPDAELISWNDDDGFGQFLMAAMDEIEYILGSPMKDEHNATTNETVYFPNGTAYPEGYDLGINVVMREYLLDPDRSLTVNVSDLAGINQSAVLVDLHDQLTETNISLVEMKVYGLDTFTVMQPFQRFGNFTLQNALSWEYLAFDITLALEIKASTLEDSLIRDAERVEPYVDELHITVGIEDIETVISLLIAVNPDAMKELQLGTLIDVASMIPCVLSSLHEVTLAGLNFTIGDIQLPTGEGLVSPGIDRLMKDGIELVFFMYKSTILEMIPTLFATTVRDLVSELLDDFECPEMDIPKKDSFIDLRDLLLGYEEAEEAGATGTSPYGDLTSTIYGIAQGMWEEVEDDGTLGLNSLVIEPVTEAISEVPGRFEMAGTLFNWTTNEENQLEFKELVDRFEVVIYDLKVDNLNTIVHPMAVIQPVNHPYITQSTVNMGPVDNAPINASISVLMSLDIEDSPLAMDNIVTFGFSMSSLEIFVEILTMLSQNNFLNYKLGDGFNPSCWFSVITPPELNDEGFRVEGSKDQGMEMRRFLAKVSDLNLHIDCIQCSPGLASLPNIVDIFDRTKVTQILSYRIPLFAEEIAISEAMQVAFDRWLVDAPHACPHRPEYNEDYERPAAWGTVEFDQLSVEASDTIFFTAIVAAELAYVLLVETHYPWELDTLAPLSGQENFIAPEGSNVLNFTNVTDFYDSMSTDVREYLGEVQVDQETKEEDLGVNLMMRDFAEESDGFVDIVELLGGNPIEFSVQGVVFMFHSIRLRGLDSFTRFDVMKPIAPQTVLNSMHMRYLEVDVDMSTGSRDSPEQNIVFSFSFEDINATVPIFAAIDLNVLESLELGHFMLGGYVIDCLLSSAIDIHFPQLLFTLGNLTEPTFKGFLPDSDKALRESISEIFDTYGQRSLKALPIMFDVTARTFINTFISDYIRDKANCTHIRDYTEENTPGGEEPYPYTGFMDLRDLLLPNDNSSALGGMGRPIYGDLLRSLLYPIQEEILWVDPETGLASVNDFIGPLGEIISGEEGTIIIPGSVVPPIPTFDWEMGTPANITFEVGDIRIENIDSIGAPLALLMPTFMRPYHLRNSAGLGMGGKPLTASVRFTLEILQWNDEVTEIVGTTVNDMIISLSMENATGFFDALVMIDENKTIHFPMRDVLNPFCWLSVIPSPKLNEYGIKEEGEMSYISLTDVAVAVQKLNMTVECIECGSQGAINLVEALNSPGAVESLTNLANEALNIGEAIAMGNLVQDNLDRVFNEFTRYCPHHPNYVQDVDLLEDLLSFKPLDFSTSIEVNSLVYLLSGVVLVLVIAFSVIGTVVKWIVNRRHQKWLRTLPVQKVHIIQHLQWADDQLERELNHGTKAMILTKEIPCWIRWVMPFIIIGNCAMFLSGHLDVAADVAMTWVISGETIPMDQFFSFSIIESTIQMWDAGAREMAIFLLIFSGIWPYTKQLISLFCWIIPPTRLSISTRGRTYEWLDILAKWSMVDIFVILLYMISFRVKATTPDLAFLPTNFFALEFYIIPRWGIYANLIAQMISQLSSHFIIHYHRAIVRRATREYEARHAVTRKPESVESTKTADDSHEDHQKEGKKVKEKSRLCDGAFARPHKGESSKLVTRQIGSYGLAFGTFLLVLFLILGCSLDLLSVEIQGLMSYLSGENAYNAFNVFDIAVLLYEDSVDLGGFNNIAGHILLGAVMILTVFIVPVFQSIALAVHWFRPMDDTQRRKLAYFIEICQAWQYAEVFILAMLVCSWQQGQTSELVMEEMCADFNEIFKMLAYYGIIEREKAHCFRVEATILTGAYFLLCGSIFLAILNSFVMKASFHHYWDKECIRKEEAMDEHLTFEEAVSPIDDKAFKDIRPPPVLFTDTFRWVLRPEHLGDRPLKPEGILLEDGAAFDEVEKLSSASETSWQAKEMEESITKSADDTKSLEEKSLEETRSLDVDVDIEIEGSNTIEC